MVVRIESRPPKGGFLFMGANLSRASQVENVSTTLSAGITDVATSMDVGDATKLNYPSYLVIDRVDAAGTLKSTSLWEYVKVTNIVGGTLTIIRAQGGSTQQAHSSGAVVEAVMTAALQEEYYNAFNPEHTAIGGHVMSQATIAYLENARMAVSSICSIVYSELRRVVVSSVASIARTYITDIYGTNATISVIQADTLIVASTASITLLNEGLQLSSLKRAVITSGVTTNSTSLIDLPGAVVTVSPTKASDLLIMFSATANNDIADKGVGFGIQVDGVSIDPPDGVNEGSIHGSAANLDQSYSWTALKSNVTAANHGVKVIYRVYGGSGVAEVSNGELIVIPFAKA